MKQASESEPNSESAHALMTYKRNAPVAERLVALVPAGTLFSGLVVLFSRGKTLWYFLQLHGAGCLVVVTLTGQETKTKNSHFCDNSLLPFCHSA
jgi:hypothetical protein